MNITDAITGKQADGWEHVSTRQRGSSTYLAFVRRSEFYQIRISDHPQSGDVLQQYSQFQPDETITKGEKQ